MFPYGDDMSLPSNVSKLPLTMSIHRLASGSGTAYICGPVFRSRGATVLTVFRHSLELARGGLDRVCRRSRLFRVGERSCFNLRSPIVGLDARVTRGLTVFCGVVEARPFFGEAKLALGVFPEASRELQYAVGSGAQLGSGS
ncbi:hypothetical protein YC2023_005293 [Brassica napus]